MQVLRNLHIIYRSIKTIIRNYFQFPTIEANKLSKTGYGQYLLRILKERPAA